MNDDQTIESITKLDVKPGDVLLVKTTTNFPPTHMQRLQPFLPKGCKMIWLRPGMDVSVLTDADLAKAGLARVASAPVEVAPPVPVEAVPPLKAKRGRKKK